MDEEEAAPDDAPEVADDEPEVDEAPPSVDPELDAEAPESPDVDDAGTLEFVPERESVR